MQRSQPDSTSPLQWLPEQPLPQAQRRRNRRATFRVRPAAHPRAAVDPEHPALEHPVALERLVAPARRAERQRQVVLVHPQRAAHSAAAIVVVQAAAAVEQTQSTR